MSMEFLDPEKPSQFKPILMRKLEQWLDKLDRISEVREVRAFALALNAELSTDLNHIVNTVNRVVVDPMGNIIEPGATYAFIKFVDRIYFKKLLVTDEEVLAAGGVKVLQKFRMKKARRAAEKKEETEE